MPKEFVMSPYFVFLQEKLLDAFPKKNIDDLHLDRVESFFAKLGFSVAPYIIFDRDYVNFNRIQEILEGAVFIQRFDPRISGFYVPEINLVFILRERDFEQINGPIYTERILAHELAHATSQYRYCGVDEYGVYISRVGFSLPQNVPVWGVFLEEGWAEMLSALFFWWNAQPADIQRLRQVIDLQDIRMESTIPLELPGGEVLSLPVRYSHINKKGRLAVRPSAYAGYALELLCQCNPDLFDMMVLGRRDVTGLMKLAQAIDAIMPGLYGYLQSVAEYSTECFFETLLMIISEVFGGIEGVISAEGYLRIFGDRLLYKSQAT